MGVGGLIHSLFSMESIKEVIKLFRTLNIDNMLSDIMDKLDDDIINRNQADQLSFGIDALGQTIETLASGSGNVYAKYTIGERKAKGLQTSNVDLKVSGKFWKTFKVKKVTTGWEVTANFNLYDKDIRANFSTKYDFLGLTPFELEDLVFDKVFPELKKRIRKHLKI